MTDYSQYRDLVQKQCEECGGAFRVPRYHTRHRPCRFCSVQCAGRARTGTPKRQPIKRRVINNHLPCAMCGEVKPSEAFSRDKSRSSGRHSYCSTCRSERRKKRRRSDPEWAAREVRRNTRYAQENRAKARLYARTSQARRKAQKLKTETEPITADDVKSMLKAQRGRCWWCGTKVGEAFDVDHVIPLSKGGPHTLDNLVIACQPCNRRKHARMPWDFAGRLF